MPDQATHPLMSIASAFLDKLNVGDHDGAIEEFYADDCSHHEAYACGPDMPQHTTGKDALLKLSQEWAASNEVHGGENRGPFPHGDDRFIIQMSIDVTPKVGPMAGQRMMMEECGLYTVVDGKITKAEFFYAPPPGM